MRGRGLDDDDWVGRAPPLLSSSESELLDARARSVPIVNFGWGGTVLLLCEGGEGVWTVRTGTGVAGLGVEEVRRGIRGRGFPALLLSRRVKLIAEEGEGCLK